MLVLAIDTALAACAASVLDTVRARIVASETLPLKRGHAEALMPLVARALDRARVEFGQLDRIAVTIGPGSFTGLRVGIAAARGISLAAGKPAVGLSTLAGLAAPYIAGDDTQSVVAAIDARHGNVYLQVFGPRGRTLVAPRLASLREALKVAMAGPTRLVGSGAEALAALWPKSAQPPTVIDPRGAPDIDWLARLGAAAPMGHSAPKPLYLRAPDAQPQDAARLPRR